MHIHRRTDGYLVELTDDERSAMLWALEAGRALLVRDPDLEVLAAERAVRPEALDHLADALFLGRPAG